MYLGATVLTVLKLPSALDVVTRLVVKKVRAGKARLGEGNVDLCSRAYEKI